MDRRTFIGGGLLAGIAGLVGFRKAEAQPVKPVLPAVNVTHIGGAQVYIEGIDVQPKLDCPTVSVNVTHVNGEPVRWQGRIFTE